MSHTQFNTWGGCNPSSLHWRSFGSDWILLRRRVCSITLCSYLHSHCSLLCILASFYRTMLVLSTLFCIVWVVLCIKLLFLNWTNQPKVFCNSFFHFHLFHTHQFIGIWNQVKKRPIACPFLSALLFELWKKSVFFLHVHTLLPLLHFLTLPLDFSHFFAQHFFSGRGLYILYEDVKSCPYEDVHVLWSILVESHSTSLPSKHWGPWAHYRIEKKRIVM